MAHRAGFNAVIAALVLATCGIFSIAAGAVMTDMALTLAMTMAMVGFTTAGLAKTNTADCGVISVSLKRLAGC